MGGRALNDKFIPCRNASLLSFAATIGLFSPNIIAAKILPFIIKYTCDPHKTVRDSSFKCIEIGLQRLKQHALTLPDKPIATQQNTQKTGQQHTSQTADSANTAASYLGNVSSWAQRISGYSESSTTATSPPPNNANNNNNNDNHTNHNNHNLDDFFAETQPKQKAMKLVKHDKDKEEQQQKEKEKEKEKDKKDLASLDDFLASFNEDLNKINEPKPDTMPKSKIKYKNKKKKRKKKKEKTKTQQDDAGNDDFFNDW